MPTPPKPKPKPEPFVENAKKLDFSMPASNYKKSLGNSASAYKNALMNLPPKTLKAILNILMKGVATPRGESPMPYSRLGQPMD